MTDVLNIATGLCYLRLCRERFSLGFSFRSLLRDNFGSIRYFLLVAAISSLSSRTFTPSCLPTAIPSSFQFHSLLIHPFLFRIWHVRETNGRVVYLYPTMGRWRLVHCQGDGRGNLKLAFISNSSQNIYIASSVLNGCPPSLNLLLGR